MEEKTKKTLKDYFLEIATSIKKDFKINDNNREAYNTLFKYFLKRDNLEEIDNNKGILLVGSYGSGKTLAMKIFKIFYNNVNNSKYKNYFEIFTTDEIIDSYSIHGREGINSFNRNNDICIDDLGADSGEHYHYKEVEDPISILLYKRYDMFTNLGLKTHATTNLAVNNLSSRFSERIIDRMYEMFNIVYLPGESWRRK